MKFGKVSKTKDLNEYDDVRIVGKTFPHNETHREIKNSLNSVQEYSESENYIIIE